MADNQITSLQEIIIRRINREFQISKKGNRIQAILCLPVRRFTKDNAEYETFNRHLTVENTGNGFRAVLYLQTYWKRVYWHRWRESKGGYTVLTDTNFNNLVKQLKLTLEKEGINL